LFRCIKYIFTVVGTELYVFGFLAIRKKMHVKATPIWDQTQARLGDEVNKREGR
jgi:hypothetical protein